MYVDGSIILGHETQFLCFGLHLHSALTSKLILPLRRSHLNTQHFLHTLSYCTLVLETSGPLTCTTLGYRAAHNMADISFVLSEFRFAFGREKQFG